MFSLQQDFLECLNFTLMSQSIRERKWILSTGAVSEDFLKARVLQGFLRAGWREPRSTLCSWLSILLDTKKYVILGSSQIPPPGGMQRQDPQQETGMPASGPSTDLTPPFQHTPLPQTGGCRRPGLRDQWTRRVTATVSAPHKTQVGVCTPPLQPCGWAWPTDGLQKLLLMLLQGHFQIVRPLM